MNEVAGVAHHFIPIRKRFRVGPGTWLDVETKGTKGLDPRAAKQVLQRKDLLAQGEPGVKVCPAGMQHKEWVELVFVGLRANDLLTQTGISLSIRSTDALERFYTTRRTGFEPWKAPLTILETITSLRKKQSAFLAELQAFCATGGLPTLAGSTLLDSQHEVSFLLAVLASVVETRGIDGLYGLSTDDYYGIPARAEFRQFWKLPPAKQNILSIPLDHLLIAAGDVRKAEEILEDQNAPAEARADARRARETLKLK
jgi:hypothetical protein